MTPTPTGSAGNANPEGEAQYALPLQHRQDQPTDRPPRLSAPTERYSDYIVYVDESGDHSLEAVATDYPVFVLAFCVFHKRHYEQKVVPAVEAFSVSATRWRATPITSPSASALKRSTS